MLVLANNDGITAMPGPMLAGSPNCLISENTEYGVQATMKAAIMTPTMQVTLRSERLRFPRRMALCSRIQIDGMSGREDRVGVSEWNG